jgi:hypothetical protein
MTKMNNWEKELSNLLTKMSEHYLIDDEFEKELKWFITNALNQQRLQIIKLLWKLHKNEHDEKSISWNESLDLAIFKLEHEFLTKLEK